MECDREYFDINMVLIALSILPVSPRIIAKLRRHADDISTKRLTSGLRSTTSSLRHSLTTLNSTLNISPRMIFEHECHNVQI